MPNKKQAKTALITGGARRIGADISCHLHGCGFNVLIHYQQSHNAADQLCAKLNQKRAGSAKAIVADLSDLNAIAKLAETAKTTWNGLDALVNNAARFYPTAIADITEQKWDDLLNSNLKAPFFLAKLLTPTLKERQGCIVNIIDIHAECGLKDYPAYSISKAALAAMTRVLAKELAPEIRVNGVSPGAVLWPEHTSHNRQNILPKILLQRCGTTADIANAVTYLINDANYVTGQIITVDGGRTINY